MSPLEIVLVVLVIVWTVIFLIIAVALIILLREIKKIFDKINNILESGQEVADNVKATAKVATAGMIGLAAKVGTAQLKKIAKTASRNRLRH